MAAPHNDNIKDKILDGASQLLQERSFTEISIADIAESCGVSKGSVYYYKSKDDLLYDIADRYIENAYCDLMSWVEDEKRTPHCQGLSAMLYAAVWMTQERAFAFT